MTHIITIITTIVLLFILCSEQVQGQDIVINEIMSDNKSTIQDIDGEFSDWIEIFNNSNSSVNLLDYNLTDDIEEPGKWIFPNIILPAHDHILIFASGKNRIDANELHTNFKISSAGEELFLLNNSAVIIDQTTPEDLADDEVYVRFPDGSNNWLKSTNPTPGSINIVNNQLLFSSDEGFHNSPFYLIITSLLSDTVYYTLDGSIPKESSYIYSDSLFINYKYSAPNYFSEIPTTPKQSVISYKAWESPDVIIDKVNILRCASYKNGIRTSKIYTQTFFIDNSIFDKYNIPVISLITDEENLFNYENGIYVPGKHYDADDPEWTGNYFEKGDKWERPVHIEYYKSDGSLGFSQDAGIRIHGAKTRHAAQKSLKLYARNEYGEKYFNYQLLPQKSVTQYKRFVLRTTMGSWGDNTIIKDVLAHEIVRDLNIEYQDYQPVIIYLNGEYWGIHTLRDRIDARYIEYTHGCDKDSVDIINGNYGLVEAGSNEHYKILAEFIELNDLSYESNYEYVKTQIDINSFVDYLTAEMFFSNKDWPKNNQKLWRPQTPDGKWRWIFVDLDAGFGNYYINMFEHSLLSDNDLTWQNMPVSTFLFRNLLKNESFVNLFVKRYAEILNNNFTPNIMVNKLNTIKKMYEDEIPYHISRWNYPNSISNWERDIVANLASFIEKRPCVVGDNISDYFNLTDFGFSCSPSVDISDNIILAPNPSNGTFFIHNNSAQNFLGNILITDISGRTTYLEDYLFLGENEKEYYNLTGLSNGLYVVILNSTIRSGRKKFIIIN